MLSVANKPIMVSVIMVSVIMVSVIMVSVIMVSVIMVSVIVVSVIMLNVVAPLWIETKGRLFIYQNWLNKSRLYNVWRHLRHLWRHRDIYWPILHVNISIAVSYKSNKKVKYQQFLSITKKWEKKFIKDITWGLYYKTFYGRNLRIFVITWKVRRSGRLRPCPKNLD